MITINLETIIIITGYITGLIFNILTGRKFAKYLHDSKLFSKRINFLPAYILLVITIILNLTVFTLSTTITSQINYFTTGLDPVKTLLSIIYTLTITYLSYKYYERKYRKINKPLTFIGKTTEKIEKYTTQINEFHTTIKKQLMNKWKKKQEK